jgi:hypothetical protein
MCVAAHCQSGFLDSGDLGHRGLEGGIKVCRAGCSRRRSKPMDNSCEPVADNWETIGAAVERVVSKLASARR